jgi:hypothetical protein
MSNAVLIICQSGTGKSTAIRTLPPAETFVLNVVDKPLPFRGSRNAYTKLSPDGKTGNYYSSDQHQTLLKVINLVNTQRLDIKYLVIDDFGYSISNDFMRKSQIKGYDKYTELGKNAFEIFDKLISLREDLFVFVMMHTEVDKLAGISKPKTVGQMIDQYVCIEGRFTYVLHSYVSDGQYGFVTNNDNFHMAKSPMDLFELKIPNDLLFVVERINEYLNEDVTNDQSL